MIHRIVLVKLTDEHATPTIQAEVVEHTRVALSGLPGVKGVAAGAPADPKSAESWDLSIVVIFEAIDDVAPYLEHPQHRAYVDEYLRPRMECIKAWNFSV